MRLRIRPSDSNRYSRFVVGRHRWHRNCRCLPVAVARRLLVLHADQRWDFGRFVPSQKAITIGVGR